MSTEPAVIAQLDAWTDHPGFNAVMIDIASLRAVREKVAALVEACKRVRHTCHSLNEDSTDECPRVGRVELEWMFYTLKGIDNG